ncbi:hypothetical protein NA57DRAFT_52913 [Rhizodiscina lignyota]|uniref:RNA exonuclease 4 n=1 Tax=Rhizodiscina lignyota TaxID=1504668 RepID=A0A9P4MDE8_9PEZI|nr:hypothetical protein NA57DRAFT_52913 [Rhizodiscina lignyota]
MEPSKLSSNWKALQKKLQKEKPSSTQSASLKRKARDEDTQTQPHKKPKLAGKTKPTVSVTRTQVKSKRRHMAGEINGSRARSISAPSKPSKDIQTRSSLKSYASTADLKSTNGNVDAHINEGNSSISVAGKYIALDCEMVGIGPPPHDSSQLARVSLVNFHGDQIYDSFVLPKLPVTDYRTHVSGITPALLTQGRTFEEVQTDVATLLQGRVLVGHAIKNDLTVLMLGHPRKDIRDTSRHKPFRETYSNGGTPSLRVLAQSMLGWEEFQKGKHSSIEDARAAMMLFKREKEGFDGEAMRKFGSQKHMSGASNGVEEADDGANSTGDTVAVKSKKKKKKKKRK